MESNLGKLEEKLEKMSNGTLGGWQTHVSRRELMEPHNWDKSKREFWKSNPDVARIQIYSSLFFL